MIDGRFLKKWLFRSGTNYDFVIKKFKSFITPALAKNSKKMIKNDIVFAGSGETVEDIGKSVAFVDSFDAYVGGDSIVLSPLIQVDSSFMSYQLNDSIRRIQLRKLGQGSSVIHIYSSGLSELVVHLPPLPEQQKIAKILTSVDEVIETTETQINKLKDLKKGMMNELLTKGIGHTEFKDSAVGRIPVGWEENNVSSVIASIEAGWSPQCASIPAYAGQWGILKTTSVTWAGFNYRENKGLPVAFQPRPEIQVKVGDILITRAGPTERVAVVAYVNEAPDKIMLSDKLIRIKVNVTKCDAQYLSLALSNIHAQSYFIGRTVGLAKSQTNISQQIINECKVAIPPLSEQQKIAKILTSIDTNIEQKQAKLTQLKNLKKSLMADLLTGRVRVTPNQDPSNTD